ncbi:MAG: PKD domain-containing protein [Owenweeksia sp.]|nr:PKD domain-containing protein [Owenweeksia sp.]
MSFFDASASQGASSYSWDFGDGNTGTGVNSSNLYTANGTYYVTLNVTDGCATDMMSDSVIVQGINLTESLLHREPGGVTRNPVKDLVKLSFNLSSNAATINLMDLSGKALFTRKIEEGLSRYEGGIDLSNLADGVYMLQVTDGEYVVNRRLIKR